MPTRPPLRQMPTRPPIRELPIEVALWMMDIREYCWEPWDLPPHLLRKRRLPRPRKPRRPSFTRLAAKAKTLGVAITLEPHGAVTVRADNTAAPTIDEWDAEWLNGKP